MTHTCSTADAPPAWTASETLEAMRTVKPTAGKVLFFLRHTATGPASAADVVAAIGCSLKTAYNALHELEEAGLARATGAAWPATYEPRP